MINPRVVLDGYKAIPSMRYLLFIILTAMFLTDIAVYGGKTYSEKDLRHMPGSSESILHGSCPVCSTNDYVGYSIEDTTHTSIDTIYHCRNGHRWAYESGSLQPIRYSDKLEGATDYSKDRATTYASYPPPVPRKVPANLVQYDADHLVGSCPVCQSQEFYHYKDGKHEVYRCKENHYWRYEEGFTTAVILEG